MRGYALLCLCAMGSTLVLGRLERRGTRRLTILYVAVVAAGVATHLFMLGVIAIHIAWIASRSGVTRRWITTWAERSSSASSHTPRCFTRCCRAMTERSSHSSLSKVPAPFSGDNPFLVVTEALGVAVAVWHWRSRRELRFLVAAIAIVVGAAWLIGPAFLFPRFFIWALPAVAATAAIGLSRVKLLPLAALAFLTVPGLFTDTPKTHWETARP